MARFNPTRILKRLMPQSLFGRALLILILPTVLVQIVTATIFYERHWDNVTRHLASSLAGDIAFIVHELHHAPPKKRDELVRLAGGLLGIHAMVLPRSRNFDPGQETDDFPEFRDELKTRLALPYRLRLVDDDSTLEMTIAFDDEMMQLNVSVKRLVSPTTSIFMQWMVGSALVLLTVAILFLRNQIRPIARLAEAAESFGRGQDTAEFRPHGALEVRRAARSFILMRERIRRQISARVEMLAGISHDLRTPLTRMKLELAMLPQTPDIEELREDVAEMEKMIQEYLDFARGEGGEETQPIQLSELLGRLVDNHRRLGHEVSLECRHEALMQGKPQALMRCLNNLVNNAIRYGKRAHIATKFSHETVTIMIDDEGPGIPEAQREEVFRAFHRLDPSRNSETGGVGLGLTIARDIVLGHGGEILLESAPPVKDQARGLRVVVKLPV